MVVINSIIVVENRYSSSCDSKVGLKHYDPSVWNLTATTH